MYNGRVNSNGRGLLESSFSPRQAEKSWFKDREKSRKLREADGGGQQTNGGQIRMAGEGGRVGGEGVGGGRGSSGHIVINRRNARNFIFFCLS